MKNGYVEAGKSHTGYIPPPNGEQGHQQGRVKRYARPSPPDRWDVFGKPNFARAHRAYLIGEAREARRFPYARPGFVVLGVDAIFSNVLTSELQQRQQQSFSFNYFANL